MQVVSAAVASSRSRVLVITGDPVGDRMAGPAIRAISIAAAVAEAGHETVLVSLAAAERRDDRFSIVHVASGDDESMRPWEEWADVLLFQGKAMQVFESIRTSSKRMVIDVYDPMHLEQLEQARSHGREVWDRAVREATGMLNEQLARADFLICASERQRLFYLGQLSALGRLTPAAYEGDGDFRGLIDVVPFGISDTDPLHDRQVLRGVHPGIGADDRILIWAGGIYDWFDPLTLIRAVGVASRAVPDLRLFFLGGRHPHPEVPEMPIVAESRALAEDLGLLDSVVFFNAEWVDYDDRQNYLLEADLGVSTHFEHIETTFSFRTRILDYLWASLPIVATRGDHFGDLVEAEGIGISVPPSDVDALAAAIVELLTDRDRAAAARSEVRRVREGYRWAEVLRPVVRYVAAPRASTGRWEWTAPVPDAPPPDRGVLSDVRRAVRVARTAGLGAVARAVVRRMRRSTST